MRGDAHALSPIVAVMLLLLITVVLASTVYLVASSLVQDVNVRPYIGLALTASNQTQATIVVAEISQANLPLDGFGSILLIDTLEDDTSKMLPLAPGTQGRVSFTSIDAVLSAGDRFVVALEAGHTYSLRVVLTNGGFQIGAIEWQS